MKGKTTITKHLNMQIRITLTLPSRVRNHLRVFDFHFTEDTLQIAHIKSVPYYFFLRRQLRNSISCLFQNGFQKIFQELWSFLITIIVNLIINNTNPLMVANFLPFDLFSMTLLTIQRP